MEQDHLKIAIDRIRENSIFSFRRVDNISEARITPLILGVLYYYGWDVFDPNEVIPQYKIPKKYPIPRKYVDIALIKSAKRQVFIEIKKVSENLNEHKPQIIGYLEDAEDVEIGVLTNAVSWIFYNFDLNSKTIYQEEEINVKNDSDSKIKQIFNKYFSK